MKTLNYTHLEEKGANTIVLSFTATACRFSDSLCKPERISLEHQRTRFLRTAQQV